MKRFLWLFCLAYTLLVQSLRIAWAYLTSRRYA